jgi:hypothetical protein
MAVTIPQVAAALQHVLGPVADAAARRTGFTRRASKLTGARFVQALVFGWLAAPQASRDHLAQTAASLGVPISAQGLDQRLTEPAADLLEAVLGAAAQTVLAAAPAALPILGRFTGVWVQDSSVIMLPRALRDRWPGCGGSRGANAALKLQVRLDLLTGALDGPLLQAGRTPDRASPHQQGALAAGALRLADLGFFSLARLRQWAAGGEYWLTRVQAGTVAWTADGRRWALPPLLAAQPTPTVEVPIRLGASERLACRLLAARVPQEVADQRRRRLKEAARKTGRAVSGERLALCAWTVFVTNVPPERLTLGEALVLARARWQIELLFKLWKGHNHVDEWRSAKPWAVLCEVYAKLLGVLIQHWALLVGCWGYPDRSLPKAAQAVRAKVALLVAAFRRGCPARLAEALDEIALALGAGGRINKRRAVPHTYQLLLALADLAADGTSRPPRSAQEAPLAA